MSAKNKILLSIGVLFAGIILLIAATGYLSFSHSSEQNYTDKLKSESQLIGAAVSQKMLRNFDMLNMAAGSIDIDAQGKLNESQLVDKLKFMESHYKIVAAFFALADGTTYRHDGAIANFNAKAAGREWYLQIMAGKTDFISVPYKASSGKIVMSLVEPVIRDGRIVGIIGANIGLAEITDYIATLSEDNQVFLSRDDGYILAAHNANDIGKNLYKIRPVYKNFNSQSHAGHTYKHNGVDYFVINAAIPQLDWNVWSWETVANINAASRSNLMHAFFLSIGAIVISLVIIYFLVIRLMYRPIGGEPTEIERMVKNMAKGDLSIAGSATGKETGILAATLEMADNLKSTVTEINLAAEKIDASSDEMTHTASQVKSSSESQMVQLEQAATAMNEMSTTVNEVARNAMQASDSAKQATGHSEQGMLLVDDMNRSIATLVSGIETVVDVNNGLEAETQSIGQILEVIDGISEQTNLLALNAAIEAARAGEAGRGFAVVADEVRNLANQTKESTNTIQETISRLQHEASRSVSLMKESMQDAQKTAEKSSLANDALQEIKSSVSLIEDMNTQIAAAVEEQSQVAAEIGANVVEINDLAKSTFDISKNNYQSANELTAIAGTLNKSIEIFKN